MLLKEILELYDLLDRPGQVAGSVTDLFAKDGQQISVKSVRGKDGTTEFTKIIIPGKKGKLAKGKYPTLGIIGRLGGVGARPGTIGFVSDGDGALTALSVALRLARMKKNGDILLGDIIIATHIDTDAPTEPHDPVPFMGSAIDIETMNKYEVDPAMDAIVSIDTSRGNRIINKNGFAISPTVKEGWILRISEDLLTIMQQTTGSVPAVLPISMQDITPYENDIYHFNSILQPACATIAPVVGVAITSEVPVPGCATGITNAQQIDQVGRFVIEVAKSFTEKKITFFDEKEYAVIQKRYGSMKKLQTPGKK